VFLSVGELVEYVRSLWGRMNDAGWELIFASVLDEVVGGCLVTSKDPVDAVSSSPHSTFRRRIFSKEWQGNMLGTPSSLLSPDLSSALSTLHCIA
jgi:hypothetical protein